MFIFFQVDADVIKKELKRPELSSEDEESSASSDNGSDADDSYASNAGKKNKQKSQLQRVNSSDLEQETTKERWQPNDCSDSVKRESSFSPPCTSSSVVKPLTPVFGVPPFSIRCSHFSLFFS